MLHSVTKYTCSSFLNVVSYVMFTRMLNMLNSFLTLCLMSIAILSYIVSSSLAVAIPANHLYIRCFLPDLRRRPYLDKCVLLSCLLSNPRLANEEI